MDPLSAGHSVDLISQFLTPQFVAVALAAAGLVEVAKASLVALLDETVKATPWFKILVAVLPIALGAVIGHFTITSPDIHPAVLGIISGAFAASGYATLKPLVKSDVRP
jgi:hypothetical protein